MSASPVEYNGTIATGGDSLHDDLNIYYNVSNKMDLPRLQQRVKADNIRGR